MTLGQQVGEVYRKHASLFRASKKVNWEAPVISDMKRFYPANKGQIVKDGKIHIDKAHLFVKVHADMSMVSCCPIRNISISEHTALDNRHIG